MKKSVLKITALFMSLLMLVGMAIIPVGAEDTTNTAVNGLALIESYGLEYEGKWQHGTDKTPVSAATLVDGSANGMSNYLVIKFGTSDNYPVFQLPASVTATGLTDYTIEIDVITTEGQANQGQYLYFAKNGNTKVGFLYKTGSYTDDTARGIISQVGNKLSLSENLIFGQTPLANSSTAVGGYHSFKITVSSGADGASAVNVSIDGVDVSSYITASAALTSYLGFSGWGSTGNSTIGFDNIKVTDNSNGTNNVVYEEDFESTVVSYDDISAYRSESGFVAPTISLETVNSRGGGYTYTGINQIFAGWYTDAACTTPLATDVTTGAAYAKFVPADVLTVQGQITDGTTSANATTDLRLVSTVDCLDYQYAGFRLVYNEATGYSDNITTVYKTITGADNTYVPTVFSSASEYFVLYNITSVPTTATIAVNAYWVTADGTTVNGEAVAISIADAIAAIAQS